MLAVAGTAETTLTVPGDLEVREHRPEPDALMNHYALKNRRPSSSRSFAVSAPAATNASVAPTMRDFCANNAACDSGPLTFLSGETEWLDADGNSIAGPEAFTAADFDGDASLNNVGIAMPTRRSPAPGRRR